MGNEEVTADFKNKEIKGMIADIAATVLDLFNIKKPSGMIGESLINRFGLKEDEE